MSMDKRRDEIGKLLACLLVSRKGVSTIKDLERDYRENEGRNIPYKEFGCLSSLDFFRGISNHVRLVPGNGGYLVYPIVSDKIKHVNDLVARQKSSRRQTPVRRRLSRYSQCFPPVPDPKPFIPNTVQKEIARILTTNQSGVDKRCIAKCLDKSEAVAGSVNSDNVDDYLTGMPYTAVGKGNKVYPSRALSSKPNTIQSKTADIDGFEIVTPDYSDTRNKPLPRNENNNTQVVNEYPAGDEGEEEYYDDEDEYTQLNFSHMNNNHTACRKPQSQTFSNDDNRPRMSSAEFIHRAGSRYNQSQYDAFPRQSNNEEENCRGGKEFVGRGNGEEEEEANCLNNEDCTFESDDDGSIDIINSRLKSRLQELIQKHPDGIWCANLLQTFLDAYNVPLEYTELGFGSVCELASELPKIFHLHRQNDRGDFLLYDATKPLPPSAVKPQYNAASNTWENEYCDDDVDPFPMSLPTNTSRSLVPAGVMTHGESVGQERIPDTCPGEECLEIYVVEVYTPSLFWVHLRKKRSKLSQLMEAMHDFYQREGDNFFIPQVILERGLNCVCTFEEKWHRAIIKTVKPDGDVTLIFYDYGTTKTYPPDALRYLVRIYSNLPAQAIACGLYNVKPVNADKWTRGASSEFYTKVADLPLVAIVVKIDRENNSMLVSLVDTLHDVDEHINDWLVNKGLAESGFMGDTVVLECSYLEDQTNEAQEASVASENVPLVSPQSTLPENSGSTLKPPPGLMKPTEPMNYAAFMDDCLNGTRNYNTAEMGNFCDVNMNNIPLTPLDAAYNPLLPIIQFWKQQVELMAAVNQFVLTTSNASVINTMLNNSNIASPTRSPVTRVNSTVEKSPNNPFRDDQGGTEISSNVATSLNGSIDSLMNLTINDSNRSNVQNSTTLPNVSSRESTIVGCDKQKLFTSKPKNGFGMDNNESTASENCETIEKKFLKKTQIDTSQENIGENIVTARKLHDTNPFKQHIIDGGFNSKINSCEEQSLLNFKPPIPPRNPNLINNTGNITARHQTHPTSYTALPVYNNLQNIPITKIYYKADPVKYNLKNEKTNEANSKLDNLTTQLTDSVSFQGNDYYDAANSSQDLTNHSLSRNTLLDFGNTNSSESYSNLLQSGLDSQLNTTKTDSIFIPSTNHTQGLSPRILTNNYRPPLPPYSDNNSREYAYKKKSPVSPQFTSPVVSENSKAAIEEVQLNFFDKLESLVIEKSVTKSEERTSSSSITDNNTIPTTNSSAPTYYQNTARSSTPYKTNLIIPKFLQAQGSTVNLKPEQADTLYQAVKQEQNSSMTTENDPALRWSVEDQASCNLNITSSKSSEIPAKWRNSFKPVLENCTAAQDCASLDPREKKNAPSALPTLQNPQTSVNEQNSFKKSGFGVTSNGDVIGDNDCLKFSDTQPRNTSPNNISYPYQAQPPIMTQNYPLLHPNVSHLQHAPNYQYHMAQPDMMQHQPTVGPRVPLFKPNVHGFYPPAPPHWQKPQLYNPAFSYHAQPNHTPPLIQQPHPWNPYNSHMYVRPQTAYRYSGVVPNSKTTCKTNSSRESVSSGLHHAQTSLGQENKENVKTVQTKETTTEIQTEFTNRTTDSLTASDSTDPLSCRIAEDDDTSNFRGSNLQLHGLKTRTANENSPKNETEQFVQKDITSKRGLSRTQISAAIPTKDHSERSNGHVEDTLQYIPPRVVTNVFKPIEVNKQTIYLFNIQNEGWVCTDEIALTFTPYENHDTILRCLEIARVQINFKEVSRAQSPLLFADLDGTTVRLPRMKNSKKIKGTLHLTPLHSLIQMMYYLRLVSAEEIVSMPLQKQLPPGSKIPELIKLLTAYSSADEYWAA